MATQRRVAVIGAGMSGLVTARALQDEGIEPVVFEQTTNIGGLWNYRDDAPDGGGPAYRSLRTNTSRQVMAFSDFPMDAHLPDFPARADVLAYLHTYTHNHRLLDRVRLGVRVERATPVGDGRWDIVVRTAVSGMGYDASGSGMERFDGLVICTGREGAPAIPTYPGMETFTGTLTHSAAYTSPESYAGRDVVVVGAGSSAADIAVEVASVARRVLLSTSRGAWYVPRVIGGRPYDHQLTRLSAHVPYGLRMRAFRALVLREYAHLGVRSHALRDHGLPEPPFDIWRARIVASTELVPAIASGRIGVRPQIVQLDGGEALFADGQRASADIIVACTGYTLTFPFLDASIAPVRAHALELYRHVFPADIPGLAFVGLCSVAGPQFPVAELQARWVARVFSGRRSLPTVTQMHAEIQERKAGPSRLSPYPMRVQLLDYLDEVSRQFGARPQMWLHVGLARPLLAGPPIAAQYRLDGPGAWKGAAATLRTGGNP
jgi:dimethylaniline monooxygenase (N-oxide forming)